MNKLKPFILFFILITFFSCNSNKKTDDFNQHVKLNKIVIDTAHGYPYPSNYPWEEMVKSGRANYMPTKTPDSPKPLLTLFNDDINEMYRIDAFPYLFTIIIEETTSTLEIEMVECHEKWLDNCYRNFDTLERKRKKINLNNKETTKIKELIKKSNFWRTTINGTEDFGDDGYTWEIEGIKDSIYSVVWQWVPSGYNRKIYKLGVELIKIAEKNGLKSETKWH